MHIFQLLISEDDSTAAAGPPVYHLQQQPAPLDGHSSQGTGSEGANSPHGSQYTLYSSGPGLGQVNGLDGAITQQNLPRALNLTQKAHHCDLCGKVYSQRGHLSRHKHGHTGVRPYICNVLDCDKRFVHRDGLKLHIRRVHIAEKPFMCEECKRPFSDRRGLIRHKLTHSGERPHKCPYAGCQKTYPDHIAINRHKNLQHTGERPYKCPHAGCQKAYASQGSFYRHHKIRHTGGAANAAALAA